MAILPPIPYDRPQTSFEWIDWYTKLKNSIEASTILHNDLSGLQGGTGGEYYHLTQIQYNAVSNLSETIDDRVNALLVAGSGIGLAYNDGANTLTISNTASGSIADYAPTFLLMGA